MVEYIWNSWVIPFSFNPLHIDIFTPYLELCLSSSYWFLPRLSTGLTFDPWLSQLWLHLLLSGSFATLRRWARNLQIRKLELHFLNWLSTLALFPFLKSADKKKNPSSVYCRVCAAIAASDKLDVRVSGDKVMYLINWRARWQYVGQVSEITETNDLLTHVFLCMTDKNRSI